MRAPATPMTLWTIGHSTRTLAEFITVLRSHHIETVADVRKLPGSRRHPHFNQDFLAAALQEKCIGYDHFAELGGRRKPHGDSPNTAWRHSAFRGYADHMATPEFARAMERLSALASERRTAIMCAEAMWWRCHRSLIADYLKARGWCVLHIINAQKAQEHPFTSAARIVDGELSYKPPPSLS
jgi:uncharacterized protein (DUF488 family)